MKEEILYPPPLTLAQIHAGAITPSPQGKAQDKVLHQVLITPHKTTTPSVSKGSTSAPGGAALRRVAPRCFFTKNGLRFHLCMEV
jgi:hypothetical protein